MSKVFDWPVRIYWEDTDAGGIIYHANYLRFLERARTELLRTFGLEQSHLDTTCPVQFVVADLSIAYKRVARLDDALVVHTSVKALRHASVVFHQWATRGEELIVDATVRVAVIDPAAGTPKIMPPDLHSRFAPYLGDEC